MSFTHSASANFACVGSLGLHLAAKLSDMESNRWRIGMSFSATNSRTRSALIKFSSWAAICRSRWSARSSVSRVFAARNPPSDGRSILRRVRSWYFVPRPIGSPARSNLAWTWGAWSPNSSAACDAVKVTPFTRTYFEASDLPAFGFRK